MNTKKKIVGVKALVKKIAQHRRQGKKITFTNGCFDILHLGHVTYLEKAKKDNRILIIGLNGDVSVKKIKGSKRPILPQNQRAAVIAALECVDYVAIFNESTPYNLIKAVKPDILIKGADWKGKEVAGSDVVKSRGGKVELMQYLPKYSTTKIIKAILKKCKE